MAQWMIDPTVADSIDPQSSSLKVDPQLRLHSEIGCQALSTSEFVGVGVVGRGAAEPPAMKDKSAAAAIKPRRSFTQKASF